jgi:hypothetical protein
VVLAMASNSDIGSSLSGPPLNRSHRFAQSWSNEIVAGYLDSDSSNGRPDSSVLLGLASRILMGFRSHTGLASLRIILWKSGSGSDPVQNHSIRRPVQSIYSMVLEPAQ